MDTRPDIRQILAFAARALCILRSRRDSDVRHLCFSRLPLRCHAARATENLLRRYRSCPVVANFSKQFRIGDLALDTNVGLCSLARIVNGVCLCRCRWRTRVVGGSMPTVRKTGASPIGATLGASRFRLALRCVACSPRCLSRRSWRRVGVASRCASSVVSKAFFIT